MALGSMKIHIYILATTLITFHVITPAHAAEGGGASFGVLYGLAIPDAENVNPVYLFGMKGSAILSPSFSVGGYFLNSSSKDIGSAGREFTFSVQGLEAAYRIAGSSGDTSVGTRVGISKVHTEESGENILYSPYHWGVFCGYDYHLASWASLGFEGSFLYIDNDKTTTNSVDYELDSFSLLSFMISFQFRI